MCCFYILCLHIVTNYAISQSYVNRLKIISNDISTVLKYTIILLRM